MLIGKRDFDFLSFFSVENVWQVKKNWENSICSRFVNLNRFIFFFFLNCISAKIKYKKIKREQSLQISTLN